MKKTICALLWAAMAPLCAQTIFVSEFHYDDPQTDTKEFVEISGWADNDLSCYKLFYVNGGLSPAVVYKTISLKDSTITLEKSGYGTLLIANTKSDQIQNGSKDGFLLYDSCYGKVVQFVSYEGVIPGLAPYSDSSSVDIGVSETSEPDSIALFTAGNVNNGLLWKKGAKTPRRLNKGLLFEAGSWGRLEGDIYQSLYNCQQYAGLKLSVTLIHYGLDEKPGTQDDSFFSVLTNEQGHFEMCNVPSNSYFLQVNLPDGSKVVGSDHPAKLLVAGTTVYKAFCIDKLATDLLDQKQESDVQIMHNGRHFEILAKEEVQQVIATNLLGQQEVYGSPAFQMQLNGIVTLRIVTSKGVYLKKIMVE